MRQLCGKAEFAGRMFIEDELVNSTQLSILKKEINFSENFKDENVRCFYNHVTEALKKTHPSQVMSSHLEVHKYFENSVVFGK
jgi:hypothetical protein